MPWSSKRLRMEKVSTVFRPSLRVRAALYRARNELAGTADIGAAKGPAHAKSWT